MKRVIIPSAKIISEELQGIGKLPAILYPIDQKRMIDLFKEHYLGGGNSTAKIEIGVYEAYDLVQKRIQQDEVVRVYKLDELKDLGYTIYYLLKRCVNEEDSIIINFADVIVFEKLPDVLSDVCYYAREEITSKWTYFTEKDGQIIEIYDRRLDISKIPTNQMMIGLFHITHPKRLLEIFEGMDFKKNHEMDSLYKALKAYSKEYPFEMREAKEWFDIGHLDKYYASQLSIKARTFNHITIDRSRGTLTKTSDNHEKFIGEIEWYLKLPTDIEYVRPRIFSYSTAYTCPYVTMEYYAYHTLHELFLYGDLTDEQWKNTFRRIRFILNDFRRYTVKDSGIREALVDMYIRKTVERMQEMRKADGFLNFQHPICINGTEFLPLDEIINILSDLIRLKLINIDEFCIIHGDLCFSNIMVEPNFSFIKVIDPRGKFGRYDIYGDWRYDIAKLMHSVDGHYDYIIKDLFHLSFGLNEIQFKVTDSEKNQKIWSCFKEIFQDEMETDFEILKLIEALLFFSMIPLHSESREQQLAMLATGYLLLNEVEDITTKQRK